MSSPSTRPPNPGDDAVSSLWLGVRRWAERCSYQVGPTAISQLITEITIGLADPD